MLKKCNKCFEEKPLDHFHKCARLPDGRQPKCKACEAARHQERYADPDQRDRKLETNKEWLEANPTYMVDWYEEAMTDPVWAEKEYLRKRAWHQSNPEYLPQWQKSNPTYASDRAKVDVQFRLASRLRSRTNSAIKNKQKRGSAIRDLGCSVQVLKERIESLFVDGMSWNNWGIKEGQWSLDHHVPLSYFDLEDRQHFLLAHHYLNLTPLWHIENLRKNAKTCHLTSIAL